MALIKHTIYLTFFMFKSDTAITGVRFHMIIGTFKDVLGDKMREGLKCPAPLLDFL